MLPALKQARVSAVSCGSSAGAWLWRGDDGLAGRSTGSGPISLGFSLFLSLYPRLAIHPVRSVASVFMVWRKSETLDLVAEPPMAAPLLRLDPSVSMWRAGCRHS